MQVNILQAAFIFGIPAGYKVLMLNLVPASPIWRMAFWWHGFRARQITFRHSYREEVRLSWTVELKGTPVAHSHVETIQTISTKEKPPLQAGRETNCKHTGTWSLLAKLFGHPKWMLAYTEFAGFLGSAHHPAATAPCQRCQPTWAHCPEVYEQSNRDRSPAMVNPVVPVKHTNSNPWFYHRKN